RRAVALDSTLSLHVALPISPSFGIRPGPSAGSAPPPSYGGFQPVPGPTPGSTPSPFNGGSAPTFGDSDRSRSDYQRPAPSSPPHVGRGHVRTPVTTGARMRS